MFALLLAIFAIVFMALRPRYCEGFSPFNSYTKFGTWRNFEARYLEENDDEYNLHNPIMLRYLD
jgi:hypothetical protein